MRRPQLISNGPLQTPSQSVNPDPRLSPKYTPPSWILDWAANTPILLVSYTPPYRPTNRVSQPPGQDFSPARQSAPAPLPSLSEYLTHPREGRRKKKRNRTFTSRTTHHNEQHHHHPFTSDQTTRYFTPYERQHNSLPVQTHPWAFNACACACRPRCLLVSFLNIIRFFYRLLLIDPPAPPIRRLP